MEGADHWAPVVTGRRFEAKRFAAGLQKAGGSIDQELLDRFLACASAAVAIAETGRSSASASAVIFSQVGLLCARSMRER